VDSIIGSLGRSRDFDRVFRPVQRHSRGKWLSVDSAFLAGVGLPPISLYKVGDAYFVVDGHHRVSVARENGQTFIDAEVIEVKSRVPVSADLTISDLDVLGAYREFLDQTRLDVLRPDQKLRLTMPGDYARLLEHIRTHKYFVDREQPTEISWDEACTHWYDQVYMPVADTIRRQNLLSGFPRLTEADLYFWIVERSYYLTQELGRSATPWEAAQDFVACCSPGPRHVVRRIRDQVLDLLVPDELEAGPPAGTWRSERVEQEGHGPLFGEILVTVTGAPSGWRALEEAAIIARREGAVLRGLHVIPSETAENRQRAQDVLQEFEERVRGLSIEATAQTVVGDVVERIVERARWADLVVINQRRVHGRIAEAFLGNIFQSVASQVARPILAVPGSQVKPAERVLLAYDASPKAREALYIFRHMLAHWGISGVIFSVHNSNGTADELDAAEAYVREAGDLDVRTRLETGMAGEMILRAMGEEQADLLLMGGYGHSPLIKAFLGSTVDRVLRVAWFPVIICR
jgi:nucleotide-binding universal stress UspA family protein